MQISGSRPWSDVPYVQSLLARRYSVRTYFICLVFTVAVPLLAFSGFMLSRHVAAERVRLANQATEVARHLAFIMDGEIGRLIALIKGLAASSALKSGDTRRFHDEAMRVVSGSALVIVLREFGPRQLVNTQVPLGSDLPSGVPIPEDERQKLLKGSPVISGVYASPVDGEPRVAVAIAVNGAHGETYALGITVPTAKLREVLPEVASGWIVGVGDPRSMKFVTRSQRHAEVSGRPADPAYFRKATARSGSFTGTSLDGAQVLAGYAYGDLTGWLVAANVPQSIVEAPLWQSLYAWAALGLAALMLSMLLAWFLGRNVTDAASQLAGRASAIGAGELPQYVDFRVSEFQLISDALSASGEQLRLRDERRERVEKQRQQLIAELDHRAKNTLAVVQSVLTQTLRHSGSLAEAKISFSGRIRALAAAHDILTREHWGPVEFRQLLLSVTAPYGSPDRFAFEGRNVKLDPSAAVSVAMLLNELATNALQYGALSLGTGSVGVSWKIESGSSDPILDIQWKERGGPAVTVPQKKGFGMRLIEAGFSGQARVEFATEGLTCSIVVPLQ